MGKYKIALVGCGIWGEKILGVLLRKEVDVVVCDPDYLGANQGERADFEYFDKIESLDGIDLDGVIIATPSSLHQEHIRYFSGLSVPIFVEKPLATSLEAATAIQALTNTDIYVMHIWKYHPGIRKLKEIIDNKLMGELLGVKSVRTNWTSPRKDTDTLWNMAVHDLAIAESLLGQIPELNFVSAEPHFGKVKGVTVLLGEKPYFNFEVSNRYPDKHREIRLFCDNGVAIFRDNNDFKIDLYFGDAQSDPEDIMVSSYDYSSESALEIEIDRFLNYLNGGPPPLSNLEEGVRLVKYLHEIETKICHP